MKDPRAILGVPWDADPRHIRLAYKRLAAKLHPDRNPAPDAADRLKEVIDAYEFLTDPGRPFRPNPSGEPSAGDGPSAASAAMNTAEFRRHQQFRYAFDNFVDSLHRPSILPWRLFRVISAIAIVVKAIGDQLVGNPETLADEFLFGRLLLIELVLIVFPNRFFEMPINFSRRSRFDAIIPEWVVEGYGWIAMLITIAAIQVLNAGS